MITRTSERRVRHGATWVWLLPGAWLLLVMGLALGGSAWYAPALDAYWVPLLALMAAALGYSLTLAWQRSRPLTWGVLSTGGLAALLAWGWGGWEAAAAMAVMLALLGTRLIAWWPVGGASRIGVLDALLAAAAPFLAVTSLIGAAWLIVGDGDGGLPILLIAIPGGLLVVLIILLRRRRQADNPDRTC